MQLRQEHVDHHVTVQTLANVFAASDRAPAGARAWFHDEPRLRAAVLAAEHVLYRAERDVLPPVRGTVEWRLDRVTYPADDLPSGELNRSTGHWNPAGQREVFRVDAGEVVIVVRAPGPEQPTELVHCGPGSMLPVLPGSWHLTYVWHGPAIVTNAYTVTADHPGPDGKYFTRPPVRCGLHRGGAGVVVLRDRTDPDQDRGEPVWRTAEQQRRFDPELPSLEAVFTDDPDGRLLARLEECCARIEAAHAKLKASDAPIRQRLGA
jgi:hypothetical protein